MIKKILLLLLLVTSLFSNAQNCFWAKGAVSANSVKSNSIATDLNGNVFVTGEFTNSITFGSTTLTESGAGAGYIVKYTPTGTILWAKLLNGKGNSITTDNTGDLYVIGNYYGTKSFGSTSLTAVGYEDIFVAKYDATGNVIWAKSIGGNKYEEGNSIVMDGAGNFYVTAKFQSDSINFGSTTLYHDSDIVNMNTDIFIAKYDATNGNVIWAKSAGGHNYDIGYGITADGNQNAYVAGSFTSDSITFGTTTLFTSFSGAPNTFLAKYDASGNVVWAKKISGNGSGNVIAYDIKTDGSNLFITGEFGSSAKFGNDSLTSKGGYDIFLVKYDFSGNPIWAKSAGGTNNDYSRNLTIDGAGAIYTLGYFTSNSFSLGTDTTLNKTTFETMYIAKYYSSGSFAWAQKIDATGGIWGRDIAAGIGADVYFTGGFSGAVSFGSSSLAVINGSDFFVADIFQFSSGISSSVNVSCYGGTDGSANSFASGGHTPYTYLWSSTPTQSTPNATSLSAGAYSVEITEGYGCTQTSTVIITEPPADSAFICMVTVDSLSQNNVIIWDKTNFTTVDSFIIYREITTGNYMPVGSVSFDSMSLFVDTTRHLYHPNTGNPNNGTYRYKIAALSTCGLTGPISPYHNTIYIINTGGTFSWPQHYTIEGGANPVSSYVLMRDDSTNGNWHSVASVTGTQQVVNDPMYSTYQNTASWRIETQWNITCTPTRSYAKSYSNIYNNLNTSVEENLTSANVHIYPNPTSDFINISFVNIKQINNSIVEIVDVFGKSVLKRKIVSNEKINIAHLSSGIYFIQLQTEAGVVTKKIVKQ